MNGQLEQDAPVVEGSFGLGFLAGLLGGCIGLILVAIIAKGSATKKGAGVGFVAQLLVGLLLRLLAG